MAFRILRFCFRYVAHWTEGTTQFESFLLATDGFLLGRVNNECALTHFCWAGHDWLREHEGSDLPTSFPGANGKIQPFCFRANISTNSQQFAAFLVVASTEVYFVSFAALCSPEPLCWEAHGGHWGRCGSSGGAKGSPPACQERGSASLPQAEWVKAGELQEMQTTLCLPARCCADADQ